MSLWDGLRQLSSVAAPPLVASRVCTRWREGRGDLWCGERWVDPSDPSWDPLRIDGWTNADGCPQFRIRNGIDTSITIGIDWPLDLSYRPWEIATATVAALMKELSSNTEQIQRVEIINTLRVQSVKKPPRRAKAQSPSQPTEEEIQALMGDVSELSDVQKKIRRYAVLKYGAQWGDHVPAEVQKNARGDPLYEKEVGSGIVSHITTFRRALRDKDKK